MSAPGDTNIKELVGSAIAIVGGKRDIQKSVFLVSVNGLGSIRAKYYRTRINVVKGEVSCWMRHCGWVRWATAGVTCIVRNWDSRNKSVLKTNTQVGTRTKRRRSNSFGRVVGREIVEKELFWTRGSTSVSPIQLNGIGNAFLKLGSRISSFDRPTEGDDFAFGVD